VGIVPNGHGLGSSDIGSVDSFEFCSQVLDCLWCCFR